jgi:hypothetical protein
MRLACQSNQRMKRSRRKSLARSDAMKVPVRKLDENKVRQEFPIDNLVEGWFFRYLEPSNLHFIVDGTDLWGRRVGAEGDDLDDVLQQCAEAAQNIDREIEST